MNLHAPKTAPKMFWNDSDENLEPVSEINSSLKVKPL